MTKVRKAIPLVWIQKPNRYEWSATQDLCGIDGVPAVYRIKRYIGRGADFSLYGPGHFGPNNNFPSLQAAQDASQQNFDNRVSETIKWLDANTESM